MSGREPAGLEGGYAQFFVYKLPRSNRGQLQRLLGEIASKLKGHGTVRSEFHQLYSAEAFQGFATMTGVFSLAAEEELWIELDHYRSRGHRDAVMASLRQDPAAGELFRRLAPLVSSGYTIVMGEFGAVTP